MKSFFKYVLATITGLIVTFFLLIIIGIAITASLINSATSEKSVVVAENSILHIQLDHTVTERTVPNPFEDMDIPGFSTSKSLGLDDILGRIDHAKSDDKINGILLDLSYVAADFATMQEIRDALVDFKESGKFIMAYSDVYSQKAYYLASTADSVFVNPEGMIDFRGLSSEIAFVKGTLDKLGIEMQIVKVGTYKSAVEPLIQDKMSAANQEQVQSYLNSIYNHFLGEISKGRNIPADSLHVIADNYLVHNADDAVQYGLADAKIYKDQLLSLLKDKLGIDQKKDINTVTLAKYKPEISKKGSYTRERIAILYATGEIVTGEGADGQIGSDKISRELRKLRNDDKVKAVVFRVNSPGGSALASDIIWREVELLRQEKPIIVSMGDVAASGGYYIAAAADSIFAQPNTLTGSIGVFGTIPNLNKLWKDKLGVTFDGVKTAKFADFMSGSFNRAMTAEEEHIMQLEVNRIYNTFMNRVADGRGLDVAQVDSIGQGRVWTGAQAIDIGLVDRLGDIEDAIQAAANKAGIEDYTIVKYPAVKQPLEMFFGTSTDKIRTWFGQREFGAYYTHYEQIKAMIEQSGVQARLPYNLSIY